MNLSLVAISTLVKSNIGQKCLINILVNISAVSLRDYLKLANIYNGNSTKKKTDLDEMIVYGCITNKISKEDIQEMSINRTNKILKENGINIKSLSGYGNAGLRKKDISPCITDKPSIKVIDWMYLYYLFYLK